MNGTALQASQGFQLTVTSVTIDYVASDLSGTPPTTLSAYGQTGIHVHLKNAIIGTPVTVAITSGCAATGKAGTNPIDSDHNERRCRFHVPRQWLWRDDCH